MLHPKEFDVKITQFKLFKNVNKIFRDSVDDDITDFCVTFSTPHNDIFFSRPDNEDTTSYDQLWQKNIRMFNALKKKREHIKNDMNELVHLFQGEDYTNKYARQFRSAYREIMNEEGGQRVYRKAYYKSPEMEFEEQYDSSDPEKCFKFIQKSGQMPQITKGTQIQSVQAEIDLIPKDKQKSLGQGLDIKFKQLRVLTGRNDDQMINIILKNPTLTVGQLYIKLEEIRQKEIKEEEEEESES